MPLIIVSLPLYYNISVDSKIIFIFINTCFLLSLTYLHKELNFARTLLRFLICMLFFLSQNSSLHTTSASISFSTVQTHELLYQTILSMTCLPSLTLSNDPYLSTSVLLIYMLAKHVLHFLFSRLFHINIVNSIVVMLLL